MTIKDWFQYLPADVRQKAIANTPKDELDWTVSSLRQAVMCAFLFKTSKEGEDYWVAILDSLDEYRLKPKPRHDLAMPRFSRNYEPIRTLSSYEGCGRISTDYHQTDDTDFEEQYAE